MTASARQSQREASDVYMSQSEVCLGCLIAAWDAPEMRHYRSFELLSPVGRG